MKSEKIGLVNNNGNYELVNTNLFPFNESSTENCKKKLISNDLLRDLKSLEIIKEKQVNISALLELDNLQQYNDYCDIVGGCKKLTQEERNLLKEGLL